MIQRNIKLIVAYEGSCYLGWDKNGVGITLESELERVLSILLRHQVILSAAIPTEPGVHAEGQVVNFFTLSTISLDRLHRSLNALLPKDISIRVVQEEALYFNSEIDVQREEYHYAICFGQTQLPFYRFFSWHVPSLFDRDRLEEAANAFSGKGETLTCIQGGPEKYCKSLILNIGIEYCEPNRLLIQIIGNRFLYETVRHIVAVLVAIGRRAPAFHGDLKLLKDADFRSIRVIAPPHGLLLKRIFYVNDVEF